MLEHHLQVGLFLFLLREKKDANLEVVYKHSLLSSTLVRGWFSTTLYNSLQLYLYNSLQFSTTLYNSLQLEPQVVAMAARANSRVVMWSGLF